MSETDLEIKRSKLDSVAFVIATGGGAGYFPIAPATWGSLVGIAIYLAAQKTSENFAIWADGKQLTNVLIESVTSSSTLIFLILLFLIGIWSATRIEQLTGKKDPGIVVIDEIVGQLTVFLFVPNGINLWTVLISFLAFRLFDIWKPFPVNRLEALPKGLGVMADDVMAGIYAGAAVSLLCIIYMVLFMS